MPAIRKPKTAGIFSLDASFPASAARTITASSLKISSILCLTYLSKIPFRKMSRI